MKVASTTDNRGNWVITQDLSEAREGDEVRDAEPDEIQFFQETGEKSFNFSEWSRFWNS